MSYTMTTFWFAALILLGASLAQASGTGGKEKHRNYHCRDSVTGQYVSPAYARANPARTVCERTRRK